MTDHLAYLVLGLGNGAVYAALGLALVLTFKSSGVVNFATGAIALYSAYTYALLRTGELMIPVPGLPKTVDLGRPFGVLPAIGICVVISALLGMLFCALIFRPMRHAPVVAKAVASIGLMIVLQALIAQRAGTDIVPVEPIFELDTISIGSSTAPTDRIWFALVVVAVAIAASLMFRFTRFGVATEAAAESEKGAYLTGLSPDKIAFSNWALSSAVAGFSGVLIAPLVALNPIAYSLFIVPALAATLVGNFSSIWLTVVAGLAIGALQSEMVNLQATFDWFPKTGMSEAISLALIVGFLVVKGRPLPDRGALIRQDLGRAPRPDRILLPAVVSIAVVLVALVATSGSYRAAIVTSIILAVLALSQVVVTGYAGQVSLAQLTLAGVAAYSISVLNTHLGIPFPFAPIVAAAFATVVGVVVGLPALRVRGLPLTVVTLALAVFLEAFWFRNPSLNGGVEGAPVDTPRIFGISLGIGGGDEYPRMAFALLCLVVLIVVGLAVAWLRRSSLGTDMLAVRANERSAAAAGIDVSRTKLIAFAIGAFLAGLAGSLLAYQQTLATPEPFTVFLGISLFATMYIAGITSITGGILAGIMAPGGLLYLLMDRFLDLGDYYAVISGILLIVTIALNPDGIASRLPAVRWPAVVRRRARPRGDGEEAARRDVAGEPLLPKEPVLVVRDIGVQYGAVRAATDVSFEVHAGEIVGLIGPNGAGKTTVIDAMTGFVGATGSVILGGVDLTKARPHERSRAGLGRSFQDVELYDDLTVTENVTVGATRSRSAEPAQDVVRRVLSLVGLADEAESEVGTLSQGRRQLVSVARVLAADPLVALLDEPAAGLDSSESRWLGERLRTACDEGTSILLVDHDMELVLSICDRIVVVDLGEVIAVGRPEQIMLDDKVIRAYLGVPATTGTPVEVEDERSTRDKRSENQITGEVVS
ncbi:branched-chain amino acid ABC transporter permease/ATP-binding protein [Gordonia terrae]|uniref:ABC transporter n=2 Tax=Gordonia terrae TaxID=2055 RepID=A0AAD0K703_9ACTN|nr:branched-chain amino acid ABC transporter permease/ATP-binding protein [Gordonia terrae]VTR09596.1 high-affinity branched-chain amino acid ABC transporter ATP-binding protein LivG [Clostridioides difficile]ANY22207.1 ABC transporter [Gordonia terrae]AWO82948.1 ABC transporter [Gordonia terrae]VTS29702.1 Lipopolysaccharide export system ATP-binding protein LptB [Gordonia terrae]GAB46325.1 putative ABC transporter permease/ATP-binding protein [Gordonia terrae NBRC 100016]